jgi:hypothetical protein
MPYRYVLDSTVAENALFAPAKQRQEFIRIFRELASDPFQRGEQTFQDSAGRDVQKKIFGQWLISFWADHAVQEVRIVGVQRIDK